MDLDLIGKQLMKDDAMFNTLDPFDNWECQTPAAKEYVVKEEIKIITSLLKYTKKMLVEAQGQNLSNEEIHSVISSFNNASTRCDKIRELKLDPAKELFDSYIVCLVELSCLKRTIEERI